MEKHKSQKKYQLFKDVHTVQDERKIQIECQLVLFGLSCVQGILTEAVCGRFFFK